MNPERIPDSELTDVLQGVVAGDEESAKKARQELAASDPRYAKEEEERQRVEQGYQEWLKQNGLDQEGRRIDHLATETSVDPEKPQE